MSCNVAFNLYKLFGIFNKAAPSLVVAFKHRRSVLVEHCVLPARVIGDLLRAFERNLGALAACFDSYIKEETLTEIARRQPAFAVFRDSGMADDSAYVNFEQIFKGYSPRTVRRVI